MTIYKIIEIENNLSFSIFALKQFNKNNIKKSHQLSQMISKNKSAKSKLNQAKILYSFYV